VPDLLYVLDTYAWIEYFGSEKGRSAKRYLDYALAELAARTCAERRKKVGGWGLIDSVVLVTARMGDGKVVTGDRHFADLKEAILLTSS
jgi:hypothetical protein